MSVRLNPYLSFKDTAREAMTFYQEVLGGELQINTFADLSATEDPSEAEKVMHAQLETPDGFTLMGSDTPNGMPFQEQAGVSVSINGDEREKIDGFWEKLSAEGSVILPYELAPWGDVFGMCVDRFGTNWMISCSPRE
jgi:PhnB protein